MQSQDWHFLNREDPRQTLARFDRRQACAHSISLALQNTFAGFGEFEVVKTGLTKVRAGPFYPNSSYDIFQLNRYL